MGRPERAVDAIRRGPVELDPSGQFAPPAPRLPETAAVRATEIKRSERAPLLGALGEALIRGRDGLRRRCPPSPKPSMPSRAIPGSRSCGRLPSRRHRRTAEPTVQSGSTVDDAWLLLGPGARRPHLATLPDGLPSIAGGRAQLVQRLPNRQVLVQEIPNLAGDGVRYRLTAHVRGEQLGAGGVQLLLVTPYSGAVTRRRGHHRIGGLDHARARAGPEAAHSDLGLRGDRPHRRRAGASQRLGGRGHVDGYRYAALMQRHPSVRDTDPRHRVGHSSLARHGSKSRSCRRHTVAASRAEDSLQSVAVSERAPKQPKPARSV